MQMLLGIFAAKGVLTLAFKPAFSVSELLVQHLDLVNARRRRRVGWKRRSPPILHASTKCVCQG
jgi:hypothetical protein